MHFSESKALILITLIGISIQQQPILDCDSNLDKDQNETTKMTTTTRALRGIAKSFASKQYREGAGFIVHRPVGDPQLDSLDPLLLLDHLGPINYGPGQAVGAPLHPHRGFCTITYVISGYNRHLDSNGNKGILGPGDFQLMVAGSGILHDEQPTEEFKKTGGLVEGFQIWVNLPATKKMMRPTYQDYSDKDLPRFKGDKFEAKVISGKAFGIDGPVTPPTPIQYIDFHLEKGSSLSHSIPASMNALVYIYRGEAQFGPNHKKLKMFDIGVLDNEGGTDLDVTATSDEGCKFLMLAGEPIGEPIARRGPFVMNTMEEVRQAFYDYQEGKLVREKGEMLHSSTTTQ